LFVHRLKGAGAEFLLGWGGGAQGVKAAYPAHDENEQGGKPDGLLATE